MSVSRTILLVSIPIAAVLSLGCGNRAEFWNPCGNGQIGSGEECDGTNLGGATCETLGYSGGTLSCTGTCVIDAAGCTAPLTCGNGTVEAPEQCDGADLGGQDCAALGYSTGTLLCTGSCSFDTTGCEGAGGCGNGSLEADEECDGVQLDGQTCEDRGFSGGGTLACNGDCTYNESGCIGGTPDCIRYVDAGSVATAPDGLAWSTAFPTIQAGIDAASSEVSGGGRCDVWVAAGTYSVYVSRDWEDSLQLRPRVDLYGGFAGTESSRGERDWTANATIIDGHEAGGAVRVYHVVTGSDDCVLDGFTVTGGLSPDYGGGVLNRDVSPTIRNCAFEGNDAVYGGAMFNAGNSPSIIDCSFAGNDSTEGGAGIFNDLGAAPTVTGCTFSGNFTSAILNQGNSSPTITNCTFSENSSYSIRSNYSSAVVSGCTFTDNDVSAVYLEGGSTVIVSGCTFSGNTASPDDYHGGGGIYVVEGIVEVSNSVFHGNTGTDGAAIDGGSNATITVSNCLFYDNVGSSVVEAGALTIVNSTLHGSSLASWGVYLPWYGTGTVINSIAWGFATGGITADAGGTVQVEHTLVQGGHTGAGNVDADPRFNSPPARLDLRPDSPCIDSANGDVAPALDFDGNSRIDVPSVPDRGVGTPTYTDMGAYEYQP